ncbi:MAG: hypothetical protein V7K67_00060 [Nostoc sp.]|uniref:hypothetical protein n=1 Tax=Nostoc sp. TaxID=1180 RepID=UPI002FF2461C
METLFQTVTQNFHGEIETLAYPKAALFSYLTQTDLTEDDQELIMNLTEAYQEARAQAVQEGVEQGVQQGVQQERRQVVKNLLKFRFGSVDEELSRVIDSLLQLAPDDFARFLLELSSLSREDLLARFNSHE